METEELVHCRRGRLLIVDDEAPIRTLFKRVLLLALPQVQIDLAANGREACDRFRQEHHAVILLDLHMPDGDGLEAFMSIRDLCTQQRWVLPAVIFCTAFAPPDAVNEIVGDGSYHGLLRKPVQSETMVSLLSARLAAAEAQPSG